MSVKYFGLYGNIIREFFSSLGEACNSSFHLPVSSS